MAQIAASRSATRHGSNYVPTFTGDFDVYSARFHSKAGSSPLMRTMLSGNAENANRPSGNCGDLNENANRPSGNCGNLSENANRSSGI